ncbi:MAG TPA: glycosyltransferase family 39 protein [Acidobacteriaceae bacterium]|jgi:4-amino-4-deoxy-L-arabinose transferase-like glycosyltransferase|nr:glycosyltransferase family 39 protein [Acidobacteriaceae bacterium]
MATSLANPAAPPAPRESQPSHAWIWRWLFPSLGVVSLLASCILWSLKKPLAGDENFTYVELGDPSLGHLLRSAVHLGGGGMPLFYLTAWPWAHLFGRGELSLRLYSSVAICAAFWVICAVLQRLFGARAGFLGAAFALFASLIVVDQNVEARGYGLYLFLAAAAVALCLRVAEAPQPRWRDLSLLTLTQAGLVLGHVLGLLYGPLMLLAVVAADRLQRRFRLRVYLCLIAGWVALLPWIPAIRASAAVGQPHSWIPMPGFDNLAVGFSFWLFGGIYYPLLHAHPIGVFFGWFCAVACVAVLFTASVAALRSAAPNRRAAIVLGLVLVLAPLVFFSVSRVLSPIYVPRYMIPSALGIAILAATWVGRAGSAAKSMWPGWALLLLPLVSAVVATPVRLDTAGIDRLAAGQPVVCDWLDDFLTMTRYSVQPDAAEYPLDWPAALQGPPAAVGAYHLMENYRAAGYLTSNLRDVSGVLAQSRFVVLDNTQTNWFHLEIENNPRFTWRVLARMNGKHRLIAVAQRKASAPTGK